MKTAATIIRILMGLLFLFASITVLFNLMHQPLPAGRVKIFMEGVKATVYLLPLIKITELVCGIAFISGRFVPLALVIISPIIVNIFLFHLYVDRSGLPVGIFLVLGNLFLGYYYRKNFASVLKMK